MTDPHGDGPVALWFDRFFTWLFVMFQAIDQLLACYIRGFVFVWFKGEEPDQDETLSSWLGRCQKDGYRLGNIFAHIVDFFMGKHHCRDAIGK